MRFKSGLLHSSTSFRLTIMVLLIAWVSPGFSQITASSSNFKSLTQYTNSPQDSVYVFCDNIGTGVGELKAISKDGSTGWMFTWTKWDSGASDFTIPVIIENNQSESTLTNLSDGLYKVVVEKGTEVFEDQAWVLNNNNAKPSLNLTLLDCVGVHFVALFVPVDLKYNDIRAGNVSDLISVLDETTERIVKFSLSKSAGEILSATESLSTLPYISVSKNFIDQEAFEGDESYAITVIDQYGCEFVSDPVATPTYVVKADFTVDPMQEEAPAEVTFSNTSVNAEDFEWFIYKDYDRIAEGATMLEDSLLVDGIITDEDPLPYTYLHPGNYFVKLIVSSDKGPETCVDELILTTPIVVDTSLVEVPNVFTPNGDGQNDVFRVKSQSLKSFNAIVFNRWGRVVHEWKNPDEGWNGKINGKWATPGTYFYVITATGREEQKKKYTKKGSFMLIRK